MRQAGKEIKEFQTRIQVILDPGEKILKKIATKFKKLKNNFFTLFLAKLGGEIGREREKRILESNSAHTRPGGANFEKNSKKIQKITEQLFSIIFSQIGMRQAEKERKKFQTQIPHIPDPGEKILKKIAEKFKKLKNNFPALFLAKTG